MDNLDDDDDQTGLLSGADLDLLDSIGGVDVLEGTAATSPSVGAPSQNITSGKVETGSFSAAPSNGAKPPPPSSGGGQSNGSKPPQSSAPPPVSQIPRNSVQAIQRRRAQQEALARRGRQDRLAFYCLLGSMCWAVLVFLYAVSSGKLQTLQDKEGSSGFIGQGLLQVVRLKMTVFVRIPLYSFTIGFLWLRLLWWRPKLLIWMTMLGNGLLLFSVCTSLLFHATHFQSTAVTLLAALGLLFTVSWTCFNCVGMTMEDVELAGALVKEGAWWLRSPVPPEAKSSGRMGAVDRLPLVTFALLVLSLFLTSTGVAGSVHLWAISTLEGDGAARREVLSETPRLMAPSLLLSILWACGFLKSLYQCVIAQLVSTRYFNGKSIEKGSGGGVEAGAEEQGGERDFGDSSETFGGGGENDDGFPSALSCLYLAVERHARALAMGSAVLDTLLWIRWGQTVVERFGQRGKAMVASLFRRVPGLVHAIYVTPHALPYLAQRGGKSAFLSNAKAAFKLFNRNPPAKLLQGGLGETVFTAAAGIGLSVALMLLSDAAIQEPTGLHLVTILVGCWLGATSFSYLSSVAYYCNLAVTVCYAEELEAAHPDPPARCSKLLMAALENALNQRPAAPVNKEQHYSAEREALDGGDSL